MGGRAAGGRLRITDREGLEIDAAPVEPGLQDVEHRAELHVVGGGEDEVHLLLNDLVLRPLEVIAGLDLLPRLVDGVGHFLHVHLARDVEAVLGGHGPLLPGPGWRYRGASGTTAVPLGGVKTKRASLSPALIATRVNVMVTVFWSWS